MRRARLDVPTGAANAVTRMPWCTRVRLLPVAAALAVGALVAPACNSPGPCFGLGVGTKLAITIVDYYRGNPNYVQDNRSQYAEPTNCAFGFDLSKGEVLYATVASTSGDQDACQVPLVAFEPFGQWTWTDGAGQGGNNTAVFQGSYTADSSYCRGSVWVNALAASVTQDVFAAPVMGQVPPVVLDRGFAGNGNDAGITMCPMECDGNFVVSLRRLN